MQFYQLLQSTLFRRLNIGVLTIGLTLLPFNLMQAADLETILARGKLIVAVKDNSPPLGFLDMSGQPQGLEIEISRRLAIALFGTEDALELRPVNNQDRLRVLLNQEVDLAIARLTINDSRARLVDFSDPYYLDGTGIVVHGASPSDLNRARIAVLKHSDTIAIIRSHLPHCTLVGVDSYQAGLQRLEQGDVAAFAADNSILSGWVKNNPQYRQLPLRWSGAPLAIAMPKGLQYARLRNRVNQAIAQWQQSGWLKERTLFWGLPWFDDSL
jgi:polar amino acid transport system substrate-binding protein